MPQIVRIDAKLIHSEAAFHAVCADVLGFPAFYGRNLDAWIDCMSDLRRETGMTSIRLGPSELLKIELTGVDDLRKRCPSVLDQLVDCVAAVNQRFITDGERPAIALILC